MRTILFSVIISTFNSADTIEETLESIIKTKENDLEILVVDDDSTDGTVEIIKKKNFPNLKILKCSHKGPGDIKNFALEQVSGKYICFLDSDDLIARDYFKVIRKSLALKPELLVFNYVSFDDENHNNKNSQIVKLTMSEMGTMIWNKVYSINLIKDIRFPHNTVFEDVGFSAQALLLSKNTVYINEYLYYYRLRAGSVTKNPNKPVSTHLDVIKGFEELFSFIKEHSLELQEDTKRDLSILINNNLILHIRKIMILYGVQNKNVKLTIAKLLQFKNSVNERLGKRYSLLFSNSRKDNLKFKVMFFLIKIRQWKIIRSIVLRSK